MAKGSAGLTATSKSLDPTLTALFASSSRSIGPLPKIRYAEPIALSTARRDRPASADTKESDAEAEEEGVNVSVGSDDELSSTGSDEEGKSSGASESGSMVLGAVSQLSSNNSKKDRKRKRTTGDDDDLESRYLQKLADEDEDEGSSPSSARGREAANVLLEVDSNDEMMVHESLEKDARVADIDKANRTVFLSNVSIEATSSRKAKKTLLAHLASVFDESNDGAVETLRFRSLPFSTASMPKRAAFITGAVLDATTKSVNAYVVYSSPVAARHAVAKLNGTVVLDRHLRADSVAHPSATDHRRCVFVGNLGFVDDETVVTKKVDEDGKETTETRKRTRIPMDVEEGLWRTFGQHAGKVENVRVVRDQVTRVGKGIAYVQFCDANSVEAAILLNGKKYPPMLPRELRVSRCKAPHKTARAVERSLQSKVGMLSSSRPNGGKKSTRFAPKVTAEEQTLAGRAGKLLGRSAAFKTGRSSGVGGRSLPGSNKKPRLSRGGTDGIGHKPLFKSPETIIFEGQRASATDGKPRGLKMGKAKKGGSNNKGDDSNNKKRQAKRTASWREKQT